MIFNKDNYAIRNWMLVEEFEDDSVIIDEQIQLKCRPQQYSYLAFSPTLPIPSGKYTITYNVRISKGGITVGVINSDKSWNKFSNHVKSDSGKLTIEKFNGKGEYQILIAACNNGDSLELEAEFDSIEIVVTESGIFSKINIGLNIVKQVIQKKWRAGLLPKFCNARVSLMQILGKLIIKSRLGKLWRPYIVLTSKDGGYAVRGITMVETDDKKYMLTADVGDDTISIFTVREGSITDRKVVKFHYRSTPMHLGTLIQKKYRNRILACLFNFGGGKRSQTSYLLELPPVEKLLSNECVIEPEKHTNVLLSRGGICGYRGVDSFEYDADKFVIATVDRDLSRFHLLRGNLNDRNLSAMESDSIDLGIGSEPIGIGRLSQNNQPENPIYYLSLRGKAEVIVVKCMNGKKPEILQRMSLSGLSRSSVAIGSFKGDETKQVAIAIWGSDPKDLNTIARGQFIIADINKNGSIADIEYYDAGVHPTDVVAGDFDGDGIEELAVLNYGSGLGPLDRNHLGGLCIYKWKRNRMQKVATKKIPNPRIGAALDIDGDGVDELVISLFFENKMVVIKGL